MKKRKTKIIATVGPASLKYDVFRELIKEGVDFIRINTAYSNQKQHALIFANLRKLRAKKRVGIIFDIRLPEKVKKIIGCRPSLIALSFTESKKQFDEIKKHLPRSKIIAKIESKKGVGNFEKILPYCWGVMVARGDLGIAVSLEKVPCLQKRFSGKTLKEKKFLIVATEMLLSMAKNPRPTRAEVSDVANAVFEGASAVMLSEETAIGRHPVEAVKYMRRIVEETENCILNNKRLK